MRLSRIISKFLHLLPWLGLAAVLVINLRLLVEVHELHDFGSFVAAGQAASRGENPYAVYPLTARGEYQGKSYIYPNLNPPLWLPLFELLALVDPMSARTAWIMLSLLLYSTGVWLLYRQQPVPIVWLAWTFSLAGLWNTLLLGQVYALPFLLVVCAWLALSKQRLLLAGILIGVTAALKPNLLVWPLVLFLIGQRKSAFWAFGTAGLLSLLPILRYGLPVYGQWLQSASQVDWLFFPHYVSVFSLAARLGSPWLGWSLAFALLAGLGWWAWQRRPSFAQASAAAMAVAILAAPLATPRYTLLLVPAFFYLIGHYERSSRSNPLAATSAALLVIPTVVVIWLGSSGSLANFLAGLLYPLALIIFLVNIFQLFKSKSLV